MIFSALDVEQDAVVLVGEYFTCSVGTNDALSAVIVS